MPSSDLPASVKLNPVALRRTFWSMFDGIRTLKHDVLAGVEQRYPRGPIDGWDQGTAEILFTWCAEIRVRLAGYVVSARCPQFIQN
jgi:hypothetical protein